MRSLASDEELGIGWSDPVPLTEAVRGAPVSVVQASTGFDGSGWKAGTTSVRPAAAN